MTQPPIKTGWDPKTRKFFYVVRFPFESNAADFVSELYTRYRTGADRANTVVSFFVEARSNPRPMEVCRMADYYLGLIEV